MKRKLGSYGGRRIQGFFRGSGRPPNNNTLRRINYSWRGPAPPNAGQPRVDEAVDLSYDAMLDAEAAEAALEDAALAADIEAFGDVGLLAAEGAGMAAAAEFMIPIAAAYVAVELASMAYNWFFGVSSKYLMSGVCYVQHVTVGSKKPWPKDQGAKLRLDHNWNKYTLCGPGYAHHATFFVGDSTLNYTSVPTIDLLPAVNFFDMNPNESITGSTTYTSVTNPSSDKLFVANSKGFMDFTNNSNIGIFFSIAWYRCKNQTSQGPILNHQEYLQSENIGISTIAPPSGTGSSGSCGYYDTTISTYDETANSYVGLNPNSVSGSQKVWALEKRTSGFLPASTNLRYNFNVEFNHVRSKREMDNTLRYQKGTIVGIITYHGEAVAQSDSTMVHSPCSMGWVGHQRLTFSTVNYNERLEPIVSAIRDATNGTVFKAWTADAAASVTNVP